jgi:hypothetical protein
MLVLGLLILASEAAQAHANGASYLRINADGSERISVFWDIAVADLSMPLEIDADGNGALTAIEIDARRPAIVQFAMQRIGIHRGGGDCRMATGKLEIRQRESKDFLSLKLDGVCSRQGPIDVSTNLFFGSLAYSALLDLRSQNGRFAAALSMDNASWTEPAVASFSGTLLRFLREGFRHVVIGYDHIAFLLLLLLPSMLRRANSGWSAATSGREVVVDLLKIVTAFTIAHTVALGLATTGAVRLPVQPIEVAIAASIVIAGVLNLFPAASRWRLRLAFGFGFVHGFGFANALAEIGAEGAHLAPMLAGFNLGVEFAQLSIVALTLPVLWLLSRTSQYAGRVMPALSLATALAGAVWFAGRL